MLKSFEISKMINEVYEGVERSVLGSILVRDDDGKVKLNSEGHPGYNNISYQSFLTILSSVIPKSISGDMDVSGNVIEGENRVKGTVDIK